MKRSVMLAAVLLTLLMPVGAANVHARLSISRGWFHLVGGDSMIALAFHSSVSFQFENPAIQLQPGDSLILTLINRDTAIHSVALPMVSYVGPACLPSDSITCRLHFPQTGVYLLTDPLNGLYNRYMGAALMVCVGPAPMGRTYYWNLKDHQKQYNQVIQTGGNPDMASYYPDYFTINGKSFPDVQVSPEIRIEASVGDTLYIYLANTGQSAHSIHFHGFHETATWSGSSGVQQDAVKDTWPVKRMESLLLILVPDKVGEYSVHDHNLVAISGGNIHPNGMFTIMKINP